MQKRFLVFLFSLALLGVAAFLFLQPISPVPQKDYLTVAATIYPIAEFVSQVGGESVKTTTITPSGTEPHDFEPTSKALTSIYQSDLFIYNGGGVDAWATKLTSGLTSIQSLSMSGLIANLLPVMEEEDEGIESQEKELFDEHIWLSPKLASQQVVAIRDTLISMDLANAKTYRENADSFLAELSLLDQDYIAGLATCDLRVAVTSHAAFAYLARDYNFEQIPITGLSPDEEPSAGDLAAIADEARKRKIKYIFFETLVSPKLAQTLATEIGAQTLVFNPLEGLTDQEQIEGKNYVSIMRDNLKNLRTAMSCP